MTPPKKINNLDRKPLKKSGTRETPTNLQEKPQIRLLAISDR